MVFAETSQKLCGNSKIAFNRNKSERLHNSAFSYPGGQYLETSMTPRLYIRLLSCRPLMFQNRGTAYSTVPTCGVKRRHESKYCSLHSRLFCDYDQCKTTACARARYERHPRPNGSSDGHDLEHAEAQLNRELERCRPVLLQGALFVVYHSFLKIGELVRLVSTRPVKLSTQDAPRHLVDRRSQKLIVDDAELLVRCFGLTSRRAAKDVAKRCVMKRFNGEYNSKMVSAVLSRCVTFSSRVDVLAAMTSHGSG